MKRNVAHNQTGMVAILVTMIMMIVISLIVLGFAQVTRRNQREALNNQLSTQAYYAAESGVNFAQRAIQAAIKNGTPIAKNTSCDNFPDTATFSANAILNNANSTAITCLLVNPTPPRLRATPLNTNSSIIWHLEDNNGVKFKSLTFKWASSDVPVNGSPLCSAPVDKFVPADEWQKPGSGVGKYNCNFAVLRVDLVQEPASVVAAGGSAAQLAQNTVTLYLMPSTSGTSATISQAFNGATNRAIIARCKPVNGLCSVTLNLNGAAQSVEYYARLSTIYEKSNSVEVSGTEVGGSQVPFKDGQAVVDSTGKAQDQLRRIQVWVPLTRQPTESSFSNYGLQATSTICKQLTVGPTTPYTDACP